MMSFNRGKNRSIYLPLRSGGLVQRSTGSSNKQVVKRIEQAVRDLKDQRRWTLLEALTGLPCRVTLLELHDAVVENRLDALEASLSAVALASMLDAWQSWVVATRGRTGTDREYRYQVESFLTVAGATATTADIDTATVTTWLTGLTASTGTRRKYFYALKSFVRFLRQMNALKLDPLAGYRPPVENKRRERWETEANDRRIVAAANVTYRAFFAFVKATGRDVGAARRALARDIDVERGVALLRGTKTARRQVAQAVIEPWALPVLNEHMKGMLPNAPLWPTVTNSGASHHHARCCEAVGVEDYTLKDARHSVAVRMRFAGKSFEEIAEQLGNTAWMVADTYARFKPQDRPKAEIA